MEMSINQQRLDDKSFELVTQTVHKLMGITIKPGRQAMIEGRLRKRLRECAFDNYENYIAHVKKDRDEQQAFINAIATNETYFYRTPRIWSYLSDTYLKNHIENHTRAPLRVWSAASSTGEEAHTLGIFLEHFKQTHPGFDYTIDATDISSRVLEIANSGVYNGRSIERFRQACPELFNTYMQGNDNEGYRVLPNIKSKIKFSKYNLFDRPRKSDHYHVILIRNVLIYFNKQDQTTVMSNVAKQLTSDGITIIGESESLNGIDCSLQNIGPTIYGKTHAHSLTQAA